MTKRKARLWSVVLLSLLMLLTAAPVEAAGNWKSLRSPGGDRIRWHACTVEYSVDMNGYPASRRKALNAAIRSTEQASGVDFVRVRWSRADLKISLVHRSRGWMLAITKPRWSPPLFTSAQVIAYRGFFRYSYRTQVDNWRHEFGHVLGLDHVRGSDIMNASTRRHVTRHGWSSGLRWLYRGCR